MSDNNDRWTSDKVLNPQGMAVYADQVRILFRDHKEDFRSLAVEMRGDLVADPMPGDNALQARYHAWQVARVVRQMESHAQKIVALAKQLDATYQRVYVELPKARAAKAEVKALQKTQQAGVSAQSAANLNRSVRNVLHGSDQQVPAEAPAKAAPVFDLFKSAQ